MKPGAGEHLVTENLYFERATKNKYLFKQDPQAAPTVGNIYVEKGVFRDNGYREAPAQIRVTVEVLEE